MNTRNLPASVLLVLLGAGATLLIGAFTRFDPSSPPHLMASAQASSAPQPAVSVEAPSAEPAIAPTLPAAPSSGLAEVIKLAKAHVDESVILAYIKSSHQAFAPAAEEILYLSDLGLSQDVIGALVGTAPSPTAPAPAPAPPQIAAAPEPMPASAPPFASAAPLMAPLPPDGNANAGMFYNDLEPYGAWEQQPDYGLVWQPAIVTINADWSPYVDGGQWLNSDSGWYWNSDYTWGWAPFHYGRWAKVPGHGWVWQPGGNWSPAWVAWRSSSSYVGWAAMPPGAGLNVLGQLTYKNKPAGANATFGLPASAYTFVQAGSLASRNLPRRAAPASRISALFQSSVLLSTYSIVNNRIVNGGISPADVASARQRAVRQVSLRTVSSRDAAGLGLERGALSVYVPASFSKGAANESSPAASAERPPSREPVMLADNITPEAAAAADEAGAAAVPAQLPPLRYPSPPTPGVVQRPMRKIGGEMIPHSLAARPNWQGGFPVAAVERPSSRAPRFESYNQSARQVDMRRPPVEFRTAPAEASRPAVEYHPAQVQAPRPAPEPARAAPAQSALASTSKSGR
ncbi:MAG TPA: DUF6600 domain-containing protein [Verrucomicrobiae bacterium]|jgi:hypothetical protein